MVNHEPQMDLTPLIAALAELFTAPADPCRNCGGEHHAKGLCRACYERWDRHGRPGAVPPRQRRAGRTEAQKIALYDRVRKLGATVPQAAKNAGIPESVAWRNDGLYRGAA